MINKLAAEIHANAKSKGFYDEPKNIGEMLCLIHSEVSEALEADRKGNYARDLQGRLDQIKASYSLTLPKDEDEDFKRVFADRVKDSFECELADIMIRVMDLAAYKGIDLEYYISVVMRNNSLRPFKHGKKY